jgi:hypothetical protein
MHEPKKIIESITRHRLSRENKVIRRLEEVYSSDLEKLTSLVYDDVSPQLHIIAKFSLEAHLIKLIKEGVVKEDNGIFSKI